MKLLVLLLVGLFGAYLWSRRSRSAPEPSKSKSAAAQPPVIMVPCAVCGVHVPRSDALTGPGGNYCCAQHRPQPGP